MAEISRIAFVSGANVAPVSAFQPAAPASRAETAAAPAEAASDNEQAKRNEAEGQRIPAQRELENVISVSQDGDTVQASEQALESLEKEGELGGRVIAKPAAQEKTAAQERIEQQLKDSEAAKEKRAEQRKANAQKEDAKAEEKQEQSITSYVGYSDAQLQQLYQKGAISKQDYDSEIASRKETREQQQSQNAAFSAENSRNVAQKDEDERDAIELRSYERNEEANPFSIAERAAVIANLQQTNADPFANITTN